MLQPIEPAAPSPPVASPVAPPARARAGFVRRHWGKGIAALLVVGFAAQLGVRSALGPIVAVVAPARRELVQKVVASGRVRGPARIDLGSVVLGKAVQVTVEEGQHVKAGQLLVQLASAEAEAQVAQSKAALAQAQGRFALLRRVSSSTAGEGLRQAEIALDGAEKELVRSRKLAADGALSTQELEQTQQARDRASSQRASAAAQATSAKAGGSDYAVALAAVSQAQATLLASESRLADTRILAPADGIVLDRKIEPGSVVQPGATLLVLAKDGAAQLEVEPDEKSLAYVREGQPALASADAFPSRIFAARVTTIAPSIDRERGTVEVKLSVAEPPSNLRPDMTVSVSIEVDRRADALVLPAEAVRGLSSEAPWILVVRGARVERRDVKLGITGEGLVEIIDGASAGELVIPISAGPIAPGARVRARPAGAP
jgi:HlyD family secretion protein